MIGAIALMVFSVISTPVPELLSTLRKNYEASSKSEKVCNEMLKQIPSECSVTALGYKGALTMMKASYAWLPMDKLSYFNKGKDLLEQAIKKDPNNIELRYIRFSVQQSVPAMLGYDHKAADRQFLEKNLPLEKDPELKKIIQLYLKSH